MYSRSPSDDHLTRSPVRYIRSPEPNGDATNRSAHKSGRPTYPRANCTPDKYNSPATPTATRSEEHTSELQSLMRISYAVFCLKKKKHKQQTTIKNIQPTHKN